MSAEKAFQRLTRLNPKRDFEPPLNGPALERALRKAKVEKQIFPPDSPTIDEAWILDHGLVAEEQFTVIVARLSDGTTQAAYLLQAPPNSDLPLVKFAKTSIPQNQWFPFEVTNPSQSGL